MTEPDEDDPNEWTESFIDLLNDSRNTSKPTVYRKKKVAVKSGKSVSITDF